MCGRDSFDWTDPNVPRIPVHPNLGHQLSKLQFKTMLGNLSVEEQDDVLQESAMFRNFM